MENFENFIFHGSKRELEFISLNSLISHSIQKPDAFWIQSSMKTVMNLATGGIGHEIQKWISALGTEFLELFPQPADISSLMLRPQLWENGEKNLSFHAPSSM